MKSFVFSVYKWKVKSSKQKVGPGPNCFSEDNVILHNNELVLKINELGGKFYCAAVILEESLGYGKYVFYLSSRVDMLIENLVLGLFTWDKANCRIIVKLILNSPVEVDIRSPIHNL